MGVEQNVRATGAAFLAAKAEAEKQGYRVFFQRNAEGESVVVTGGTTAPQSAPVIAAVVDVPEILSHQED